MNSFDLIQLLKNVVMKSELMSLCMIKLTSKISVNMFCGIGYNNDGWKCNDIDECFTNNTR